MNSRLIAGLKFIVILAIAIGLLAFAFRGISLKKILNEIERANIWWVLASLTPSIMALVSRSYRWNLLIQPLGYKPKLRNTFFAVSIGYLANLAFPRLGEVTRCGALTNSESIPFNKLLGTVIIERLADVVTLLLCLILTAVIEANRLGNFLVKNLVDPIIQKLKYFVASPISLGITIIITVVLIFLIRFFIKKSQRDRKESRMVHLIKGLAIGLKSIAQLERPWLFVIHSLLIWFLYFLSMYLCFFAMPATRGLGATAALFLLVAGGLGMSAPVQGGIGAYHILVSQGLMLYGLSRQNGLAFATLVHSLQIVMILVLGGLSSLLIFHNSRSSRLRAKTNHTS